MTTDTLAHDFQVPYPGTVSLLPGVREEGHEVVYNLVLGHSENTREMVETFPTVKGDIFIVPNLAMSPSNYFGQARYNEWLNEKVEETKNLFDMRTHDLTEDRMIQVWVTNSDSENWSDHGCNALPGRFPSYIPAKWLEGLKEGDVLAIVANGVKIALRCRQTPYRYGRFGTFEEVFERVNKDYVKA